jgi:hypothetical protein
MLSSESFFHMPILSALFRAVSIDFGERERK